MLIVGLKKLAWRATIEYSHASELSRDVQTLCHMRAQMFFISTRASCKISHIPLAKLSNAEKGKGARMSRTR